MSSLNALQRKSVNCVTAPRAKFLCLKQTFYGLYMFYTVRGEVFSSKQHDPVAQAQRH